VKDVHIVRLVQIPVKSFPLQTAARLSGSALAVTATIATMIAIASESGMGSGRQPPLCP
jgi:hypothetical protein